MRQKKLLISLLLCCITLVAYAGDLIDYHFSLREYRWAEYKYDFNVSKINGKGFISIDESGSGYVYVEWNGNSKSFAFSANDLKDADGDSENVRLTYRYGAGELDVVLDKSHGAIIHYRYGDKYKIWKER